MQDSTPKDHHQRAGTDRQGTSVDGSVDDAVDHIAPHTDDRCAVTREPEQLGELPHDDHDGDPVEVAHADRLGQQVGDDAEPQHAAEDEQGSHHDGQQTGQRHRSRRIAGGQREHRCGDDRCQRGVGAEDEDARGSDERVHDQRDDGGVEPGLGGEAGDLGVPQPGWHEERREHDAGDQITLQPAPFVAASHRHAR